MTTTAPITEAQVRAAIVLSQDPRNRVRVIMGSAEYTQWSEVTIADHMDRGCMSLALTAIPGGKAPIPPLQGACKVQIGEDLVLTGYLYGQRRTLSRPVSVVGMSKTFELVRGVHMGPTEFRNLTVYDVAVQIALSSVPGVVMSDASQDQRLRDPFVISPGERRWAALERLCRLAALVPTCDEYGQVWLTRAGVGEAHDTLEEGVNLLPESAADYDTTELASHYVCKAQRRGSAMTYAAAVTDIEGIASCDAAARECYAMIQCETATDPAGAEQRSAWEAAYRLAKACKFPVAVQGWRQSDGSLWPKNKLVWLRSPTLGVDAQLLICGRTFTFGKAGARTTLEVVPPAAYAPEPIIRKAVALKGVDVYSDDGDGSTDDSGVTDDEGDEGLRDGETE